MKQLFYTITGVAVIGGGLFGLQAIGWLSYSFWGPKYEDTRRDIFEHSKAYKHGSIRDLENLKLSYETADTDAHREAIRQTILHRFAAYDRDDLPPRLRNFINSL